MALTQHSHWGNTTAQQAQVAPSRPRPMQRPAGGTVPGAYMSTLLTDSSTLTTEIAHLVPLSYQAQLRLTTTFCQGLIMDRCSQVQPTTPDPGTSPKVPPTYSEARVVTAPSGYTHWYGRASREVDAGGRAPEQVFLSSPFLSCLSV